MKKNIIALTIVFCSFLYIQSINATILTFDDLPTYSPGSLALSPNKGYGGLDWQKFSVINKDTGGSPSYPAYHKTGYYFGNVSPDWSAFNGGGRTAWILDDSVFDFSGAYLTAAMRNGLNINVSGYFDDNLLYSKTIVVDYTSPTWFDFDFNDINKLSFNSFGGTWAGIFRTDPGDGITSGTQFVMDNFTFTGLTPDTYPSVPEPTTMLLFGAGLVGLAGFGRKKFKK